MYSQSELNEAVAAGAIPPTAADALRQFVEGQRAMPSVDEEQFRLVTSFNDIFVSLAAIILLVAVSWIGSATGNAVGFALFESDMSPLGAIFVAAASWGLAMFFTAKRRMALPSILLLLSFVGAIFAASLTIIAMVVGEAGFENRPVMFGITLAIGGAIATAGAFLHWRRFHVPITIAAGAGAAVALAIGLLVILLAQVDQLERMNSIILTFVLLLGTAVFLFAMRWDSSDPARITRRSDVAFWLHLLAAPMIVHPVFALLGLTQGDASIGEGLVVVALYVGIAVAALAIDRRALLVSALAYVLYALNELFKQVGAVELNVALTALVIGSALLLLSAFWHQARRLVVGRLPDGLRGRLPLLDRSVEASPQPAA